MHVLGDDMLKGKGRMRGARFQPKRVVNRMAYLGSVLQLPLICIPDKALYQAAACHSPRLGLNKGRKQARARAKMSTC